MIRSHRLAAVSVIATAALVLAGCSSNGAGNAPASDNWRTATSVEDGGGMDALVEAAQAEGSFNSMGLYDDWANYGGLLKAFGDKYNIKINNDVSTGASQDLINAVVNRKGQDDSLDYLDTGVSFAAQAEKDGLIGEYRPTGTDKLPADMKSDGFWYNHLGGTMAIGCDANKINPCPTSFQQLLDPQYKGKVAITGDPTTSESSFMTVYAAALANGGSLDNIQPGIDYFGKLAKSGNMLKATASAGTIETGETPIVLNWDYLLVPIQQQLKDKGVDLKINYPDEGSVSSYYAAYINADAPHPAVARLFMEFLFSPEGQNLLLQGYVKPGLLDQMVKDGTVDDDALAKLPEGATKQSPQPSLEQRDSQHEVVVNNWANAVS